jgi:uncharacterized protein YutD
VDLGNGLTFMLKTYKELSIKVFFIDSNEYKEKKSLYENLEDYVEFIEKASADNILTVTSPCFEL